ncbi:KilA-N domain-containing protein [Runella limosa]|uniref:KilA-N domain-containing protein n=1 Tax=Runella limosa TaxID=370978 RepID=UPI000411B7BD|nr:KilA-N domain-containing protein [Runella limosa]
MQAHQVFEFNGQQVEFDLSSTNIMVNATEMAKIYDKQVVAFMRNEDTQRFISSCLKSENSHFLGIQKEEDLYVSKQRSGTWMHRVLALKFAAWLDSDFELWVYITIDKLMFGSTRTDLKEKAEAELRRQQIHDKLMAENPEYAEMIELQSKASEMGKRIKKNMQSQLTMFEKENLN